jgi:hypothetical protein
MAWIESHQQLGSHPKLFRLADLLDVSPATAVGHLHYLWWWSLDYAQSGSFVEFTEAEIARAAQWTPGPDQETDLFVRALRASGFLDDDDLHDWHDYAGKLLDRRKSDAERKRKSRMSTARPVDVRTPSVVTEQNSTEPDRTEPDPLVVVAQTDTGKVLSMLSELPGYMNVAADVKAARVIVKECIRVDVDYQMVVATFVDYYPRGVVLHGWKDPVNALVSSLDVAIAKVKNPRTSLPPGDKGRRVNIDGARRSRATNRY